MTTYPSPDDAVDEMSSPFGTPESHSSHHGKVINQWENVLHYGADPTGVLDSTAAIQAAIYQTEFNGERRTGGVDLYHLTGQGAVYMPEGWYRIEGTLTLVHGITLMGSGSGTVLMPFNGSNPTIKVPFGVFPSGTTIRDFVIGSPNDAIVAAGLPVPTGTGHGLWLDGGNCINVVNIMFLNMLGTASWALKINDTLETRVDRCVFASIAGGGIYITGNSNASTVTNCTLSNRAVGAIGGILVEAEGVILDSNVVEAWRGGYGIKVSGGRAHVLNQWCEDNSGEGIWLQNCNTYRVEGCYMATSVVSPLNALRIETNNVASGTVQNCDMRNTVVVKDDGVNPHAAVFIANSYAQSGSSGEIDSSNLTQTGSFLARIGDRHDGAYGRSLEVVKGLMTFGSGTTPLKMMTGSGSPETVVTAPVGSLYMRTNGSTSTTLYIKQTGVGNTGWVAAFAAAPSSAYTVTNPTTDRALNVTADTLPQVAEVLGTLIADLQTAGVLT